MIAKTEAARAASFTVREVTHGVHLDVDTTDSVKVYPGRADSPWFLPTMAIVHLDRLGEAIRVELYGFERLPAGNGRPARTGQTWWGREWNSGQLAVTRPWVSTTVRLAIDAARAELASAEDERS